MLSHSSSPHASVAWNSFNAWALHHADITDDPVGDLLADIRSDANLPEIDGPEELAMHTGLPLKLVRQCWKAYVAWLKANNANLPAIKAKPISKKERLRLRWEELPYGCWQTESGREIVFNRRYQPLWVRNPDGHIIAGDRTEWIYDITAKHYFYGASCGETEEQKLEAAIAAAQSWNVPVPDLYFTRINVHD